MSFSYMIYRNAGLYITNPGLQPLGFEETSSYLKAYSTMISWLRCHLSIVTTTIWIYSTQPHHARHSP